VTSLNVIYETKETRPWWQQKLTIVGLTLALAALILVALVLVLYGGKIGGLVASHVGLGDIFRWAWNILQWPVSLFAMLLSYSLIYYFGPDLEERKWYWVTPGAVAGVLIWLLSSIGFRVYLHFFNNYSATYGSLGAAVILMLWLYITGFAILIGGEVNWVIENEDKRAEELENKKQTIMQRLNAA
jgi:membrane protein